MVIRQHSIDIHVNEDTGVITAWGCSPMWGDVKFDPIWTPTRLLTLRSEYDRVQVAITGHISTEAVKALAWSYLSDVAQREEFYYRWR